MGFSVLSNKTIGELCKDPNGIRCCVTQVNPPSVVSTQNELHPSQRHSQGSSLIYQPFTSIEHDQHRINRLSTPYDRCFSRLWAFRSHAAKRSCRFSMICWKKWRLRSAKRSTKTSKRCFLFLYILISGKSFIL